MRCGRVGRAATPGLTLVETLAGVVLLALVGAVGVGVLARADDATRLDRAVALAADADRTARAHARAGATVRLTVSADRAALIVERAAEAATEPWADAARAHERVAVRAMPRGVRLSLTDAAERERRAVTVGVRGEDYRVVLTSGDTRRTLAVAGLTGWIETETEETP